MHPGEHAITADAFSCCSLATCIAHGERFQHPEAFGGLWVIIEA